MEGQECFATLIMPSSHEDQMEVFWINCFLSKGFIFNSLFKGKSFLPKTHRSDPPLSSWFFTGWTLNSQLLRRTDRCFLTAWPCQYTWPLISSLTQLQSWQFNVRSATVWLWHLSITIDEEHDAHLRHFLWRLYELQQQCCMWQWRWRWPWWCLCCQMMSDTLESIWSIELVNVGLAW